MHAYLDISMLFCIGAKKTTDLFVTERLCFSRSFSAIYFYLLRADQTVGMYAEQETWLNTHVWSQNHSPGYMHQSFMVLLSPARTLYLKLSSVEHSSKCAGSWTCSRIWVGDTTIVGSFFLVLHKRSITVELHGSLSTCPSVLY